MFEDLNPGAAAETAVSDDFDFCIEQSQDGITSAVLALATSFGTVDLRTAFNAFETMYEEHDGLPSALLTMVAVSEGAFSSTGRTLAAFHEFTNSYDQLPAAVLTIASNIRGSSAQVKSDMENILSQARSDSLPSAVLTLAVTLQEDMTGVVQSFKYFREQGADMLTSSLLTVASQVGGDSSQTVNDRYMAFASGEAPGFDAYDSLPAAFMTLSTCTSPNFTIDNLQSVVESKSDFDTITSALIAVAASVRANGNNRGFLSPR